VLYSFELSRNVYIQPYSELSLRDVLIRVLSIRNPKQTDTCVTNLVSYITSIQVALKDR